MVSKGARPRLSRDFLIYHVRLPCSSPFSFFLVHLLRMLSAFGGPPLPALLLAPGQPLPWWRQAPPPLQRWMDQAACLIHSKTAQHGTAQHGHHPGNRKITGIEAWPDSDRDQPPNRTKAQQHQHHCLFSSRDRTGECAHRFAGVCACACLPVWITMMQSAAVLPTESPVKSLPEILGVPLQRKTFFLLFFLFFCPRSVWKLVGERNRCCGDLTVGRGA